MNLKPVSRLILAFCLLVSTLAVGCWPWDEPRLTSEPAPSAIVAHAPASSAPSVSGADSPATAFPLQSALPNPTATPPSSPALGAKAVPVEAKPGGSAPEMLKAAGALQQNGDLASAIPEYHALIAAHPRADEAQEALFRLGEVSLLSRDYRQAIQSFEDFLKKYPLHDLASGAIFQLATANRKLGRLSPAIERYRLYVSLQTPVENDARLQIASAYIEAKRVPEAIEEYKALLDGELSASTRLEVMEKLADAYRESGMARESLAWYGKALNAAKGDWQRARFLFRMGEASHKLGETVQAIESFSALVRTYPWSGDAPAALKRLLDYGAPVDAYRQGLVRYNQGEYTQSIALFKRYLAEQPAGDRVVQSRYYAGLAYGNLRQHGKALEELEELIKLYPEHDLAYDALWEKGQLLESLSRFDEAAATYRRMWLQKRPGDRFEEAIFREGLIHYKAARYANALASWQEHLEARPGSKQRARSHLWAGKALMLLGRQGEGRQQIGSAAAYGLDEYYALRARALLAGKPSDTVPLPKAERGRGELEGWLASWAGAPLSVELSAEVEGDPGFVRGRELLAVGLRGLAINEYYALVDRFAQRPEILYQLAVHFREKGFYSPSITAAGRLLRLSPQPSLERAPKGLREFLYPLAFPDLVAAEGAKRGLDPMALLALVHQESAFEPQAKSSADAMGLTQVIPSTAREIARALGKKDFALEDLYRPVVALEFGAWYLANQFRYFDNDLFLAVAAYNGGAGNVQRWNKKNPQGDLDLFLEEIDYSETRRFVKLIYQNYELYKLTYAGS